MMDLVEKIIPEDTIGSSGEAGNLLVVYIGSTGFQLLDTHQVC